MERRTFITSAATGIAGVAAGGLMLGSTGTAQAAVSMGTFTMSDASRNTDDGNISNVTANVSGSWQYELPGGSPTEWLVQLRVSDGDSWYVVGQDSGSVEYATYNGTFEITGSLTETGAFDATFFAAPGPGKQKSVDLPFQVWFRVLDAEGTALASTKLDDTATVTVSQEAINASIYGEVSADGGLSIE